MQPEYVFYVSGTGIQSQYYTLCTERITKLISKIHRWVNFGNQLNNIYGPAMFHFYQNGTISSVGYFFAGSLHNEKGPAVINYYLDGTISQARYYLANSLHNGHYPAVIHYRPDGTISNTGRWIHGTSMN